MLFYKKKYGYLIFRIIVFVFFGGGVGQQNICKYVLTLKLEVIK